MIGDKREYMYLRILFHKIKAPIQTINIKLIN